MINNVLCVLALCCHIASIFTLRRIIKEIWRNLSIMDKDIRRCKVDTHIAVNDSAENRINLLGDKAECKASWKNIDAIKLGLQQDCDALNKRSVDMHNGRLNYAVNESQKKIDKLEEKLAERDDDIAQRFSDVDEYIKQCKEGREGVERPIVRMKKTRERPGKKE